MWAGLGPDLGPNPAQPSAEVSSDWYLVFQAWFLGRLVRRNDFDLS